MRGYDDPLSIQHPRLDLRFEVRHGACDSILQALREREILRIHAGILYLACGIALVVGIQCRRGDVVGSPPLLDLILPVLLCCFSFIESLQRTVMAFVEPPGLDDWKPFAVHALQSDVQRVDSTLQIGCEADIEIESLLLQHPSRLYGLRPSGVGKVHVGPSGEEVLLVPDALPVTEEYELHCICHLITWNGIVSCVLTIMQIDLRKVKL